MEPAVAMADLRKTIEETMINMNLNKSMHEESKIGLGGLISGEEKLRVAQHHQNNNHNHNLSNNSSVNEDVIIYSENMTKRDGNKHSLAETANSNS